MYTGTVTQLVTWLKNYKTAEGKGQNQLVSELPSSPADAVKIIDTCAARYKELKAGKVANPKGFYLGSS